MQNGHFPFRFQRTDVNYEAALGLSEGLGVETPPTSRGQHHWETKALFCENGLVLLHIMKHVRISNNY